MVVDQLLPEAFPGFRAQHEVLPLIRSRCQPATAPARYVEIGTSEEGRPIGAVIMGEGPQTVSLMAGAHSDEPVGPETLRTFILEALSRPDVLEDWLKRFTFVIIPHINPDGEARNWNWIEQWPDPSAHLAHRFREQPGRDLEFGYPAMRPENKAVSSFLRAHAPFALHMSLHGMSVSEGALLLIEPHWIERSGQLQAAFQETAAAHGLRLHDHDRKGAKGFEYIGPGFTTTPQGKAMQRYFRAQGDEATAAQFHQSSMEFVRGLGGDPLSLVTEFPLYVLEKTLEEPTPGRPEVYLAFKEQLPELTLKAQKGESIEKALKEFQLRPLPLAEAVTLQLKTIERGLEQVAAYALEQ